MKIQARKHWRWIVAVLFIVALAGGVALRLRSGRSGDRKEPPRRALLKAEQRFLEHRTWTEHQGDYFSGVAGVAGPLQLYLALEGDGYVWGRCLMVSQGQRFEVSGGRTAKGEMVVRIGSTNSYLAGRLEGRPPAFVGRWISADGRTNLPVRLPAIAERHVVFALSGYRAERAEDFNPLRHTEVAYPVFLGTNEFLGWVSKVLRDDSRNTVASLMYEDVSKAPRLEEYYERFLEHKIDRQIDFASDHAVSLWEKDYEYWGGAHGSYYIQSRNYRDDRGIPEEIGLEELFTPRSDWEQQLAACCLEELHRQRAYTIMNCLAYGRKEEALSLAQPSTFTLSAAGIHCHYSPEELGPYGQGESEVLVPYSALQTCLRRDGPAKLFGVRFKPLPAPAKRPPSRTKTTRSKK